jgi:hypothetical protein
MKNLTAAETEIFQTKAKAEFNMDPQLRADFNNDFQRYLAFLEENDDIKFKILTAGGTENIKVEG